MKFQTVGNFILLLLPPQHKPLNSSPRLGLIPLGLTAAGSTRDPAIHKKMFGFGATTLISSNNEMNDIMKIIMSLEESSLLIKGVSKTVRSDAKEQKGEFPGILLSTFMLDGNKIY